MLLFAVRPEATSDPPFRDSDIDPRKVWRPEGFVLDLDYNFVFFWESQKYGTEVGVAGRKEIAASQYIYSILIFG